MSRDAARFHAETIDQWHDWLGEHHATATGIWLVVWRTPTGRPRVEYDDAVLEALAVGWVDSTMRKLDEERNMQWYCPRRPTSGWSRPNKIRVERLITEGRMLPAGQSAIDLAKKNGSWAVLDDVEDLVLPDDLAAALDQHPGARETWESFPPSVRKVTLGWIVLAKRPETRARRVAGTAEKTAQGVRPR